MDTNSFTHLQNARRSRSKSSIWRAKDVESDTLDEAASRRESLRSSVLSVADQWAQSRPRDSADTSRVSLDRQSSQSSISKKGQEMRRWDGLKRSTAPWDEIRRDPELWFPDGDCFIHFYGRGSSRRGPSLRLHRNDLENAGCMHMLSKYADQGLYEEDEDEYNMEEEESGRDGGFASNPNTRGKDELFIPSPPLLNRDEALKFHITTRNFFAALYEKPLVGTHLGEALVLVHERYNMYRHDKERNRDDMLDYCDDQGYTDFRDCPDHAMAMMYYAEKIRETDLWTEAFVHSVGMYDILNTAIEFPTVSRTIGALITRAHLEMTLRLEHAYADLGGFMEESIGSAYPKLSEPAMKHIERFRGFLQSFYVQQHGYWPPPSLQPGADYSVVTKSLLKNMYGDFRNLYQFLRDAKSGPKPTQAQCETYKAIYGGICTPQLIGAFDRRFKHTPLPHSLPLLPSGTSGERSGNGGNKGLSALDVGAQAKPSSGGAFARFLKPSKRKSNKQLNTLNMLSAATNTNDTTVMESLLVQEYSRFERDWTVRAEEKIDPVEARKVRWLLIYALLQTLIGVIAIPREISNSEKVEYPLCVQTAGTPPWNKRVKVKAVMDGAETPILDALSVASSVAASPYLTPQSGAQSGAITPITAGDAIPPVPQLVLSELNKLSNGSRSSFDSTRTDSRSPRPPGSSANSIRSTGTDGTARPGKPKLKSSSASIRSNASTRSSFSTMMNRSLGSIALGASDIQVTEDRYARSKNGGQQAAKPAKQPKPERPAMQKQKTAPPALHSASADGTAKKLVKKERTSMFSWSRSRNVSPQGRPAPVDRHFVASPTPTSPAQSTFSNKNDNARFSTLSNESETPATSEFPQSATSERKSQFSQLELEESDETHEEPAKTEKYSEPVTRTHGQILPPLKTSAIANAQPEEDRRGRSSHALYSPTAVQSSRKVRNFSRGRSMERPSPVAPVAEDLPPPIPSSSKPQSRAASPVRDINADTRAYTDANVPPQLPSLTKPMGLASQLQSPATDTDEFYDTQSPLAILNNSRPASRASTTRSPLPVAEAEGPPPLPVHSKPGSRAQSPAPAAEAQTYTNSAVPPPMPISTKPRSRSQSRTHPTHTTQSETQPAPPPVPTRSKPTTRQASPARTPEVPIPKHSSAVEFKKPRSKSRSAALSPVLPPAVQSAPKHPAISTMRMSSDSSDDGDSVSPVSQSSADYPEEPRGTMTPKPRSNTSVAKTQAADHTIAPRRDFHKPSVSPQPPRSRGADRADRTYQRVPATQEAARFEEDDRAVIVERQSARTLQEQRQEDSMVGHAVTAPSSAQSQWPLGPGTGPVPAAMAAPAPAVPEHARSYQPARSQPVRAKAEPSYQQQLREHEERLQRMNERVGTAGSGAVRRGSSRESKYRREAWAELGGPRNAANGMPVPVPARAPIVRDTVGSGRYQNGNDTLTSSEDEDGGVEGGFGSYGVRKGIMG